MSGAEDYNAMTVNERLFAAGLLAEFDRAVASGDARALERLLSEVRLDAQAIETVIGKVLPVAPTATVRGRESRAAEFLNVDLEIRGGPDLSKLLAALDVETFVVSSDVSGTQHRVALELRVSGTDPHASIAQFVALVKGLPPDATKVWNALTTRTLCIGVRAATGTLPFDLALNPLTVVGVAEIGAGLSIVAYAAPASFSNAGSGVTP